MKRYHEELHILQTRAKKHKELQIVFDTLTPHEPDVGRFRKALKCAGCGRARCQLCHPDKYPKRIPTRQEREAKRDDREANYYDPAN
jgi:hypothetical protein